MDFVKQISLNDSKTEIIFLSSRFTKNAPPPTFKIGQSIIEPSEVSRNLGVLVDSSLRMSSHVDNVCRVALVATLFSMVFRIKNSQNTAARLVSCLPRSHHDTPVLMKLHWLPVKMRTIYKILLLTFKAQIGKSPVYLSELVHQYAPTRSLRSSQQSLLATSTITSTKFYGQRSFSLCCI